MIWLLWRVGLGCSMHVSDVGCIGIAARETYSRAGHYNTQHKALNDTPLDSGSAPLIHRQLAHTLGLRNGPRIIIGLSADCGLCVHSQPRRKRKERKGHYDAFRKTSESYQRMRDVLAKSKWCLTLLSTTHRPSWVVSCVRFNVPLNTL